jgi:hypothetical protein
VDYNLQDIELELNFEMGGSHWVCGDEVKYWENWWWV